MSYYRFDLWRDGEFFPVDLSVDLPAESGLRGKAAEAARELMQSSGFRHIADWTGFRFEVTDSSGNRVLTFPFEAAGQAEGGPGFAASGHVDAAVLLVDDDEASVVLAAKILRRAGFDHVDTAPNGAIALAMMRSKSYRLVISDWNMPEMNGLELLQAIRADDRLNGTPFLLTSIDDAAERVNRAALAGASAFLSKPFDVPALKTNVEKML
ncbi:MAG TPA: response regulator [Beijerinckiaceae bacterium]|nr:response regulator [Beijerinckiaceae bacterium]